MTCLVCRLLVVAFTAIVLFMQYAYQFQYIHDLCVRSSPALRSLCLTIFARVGSKTRTRRTRRSRWQSSGWSKPIPVRVTRLLGGKLSLTQLRIPSHLRDLLAGQSVFWFIFPSTAVFCLCVFEKRSLSRLVDAHAARAGPRAAALPPLSAAEKRAQIGKGAPKLLSDRFIQAAIAAAVNYKAATAAAATVPPPGGASAGVGESPLGIGPVGSAPAASPPLATSQLAGPLLPAAPAGPAGPVSSSSSASSSASSSGAAGSSAALASVVGELPAAAAAARPASASPAPPSPSMRPNTVARLLSTTNEFSSAVMGEIGNHPDHYVRMGRRGRVCVVG